MSIIKDDRACYNLEEVEILQHALQVLTERWMPDDNYEKVADLQQRVEVHLKILDAMAWEETGQLRLEETLRDYLGPAGAARVADNLVEHIRSTGRETINYDELIAMAPVFYGGTR